MSSRLPGFFRLPLPARRVALAQALGVPPEALAALDDQGLSEASADAMIENVVGRYALPFAVAPNLQLDGKDVLVPMVVEEPSVVAATANAAKRVRAGGGFVAHHTPPIMIGQIQLTAIDDVDTAAAILRGAREEVLAEASARMPRLRERGGGPVDLEVRILARPPGPDGGVIVVHLHVDCQDAMGANLINSACEALAPGLAARVGARIGLRILSNLSDRRLTTVTAAVPLEALGDPGGPAGHDVAEAIAAASRFAEMDPYRATTHNKGIMNGVDAVLVATGQDWRAVEAGAHAYAALTGCYRPLATWRVDGACLRGSLTLPLAVGTVGGALHLHPTAQLALRIAGVTHADGLAGVVAAAGLATNLSALRALATDGIQHGHMALHARALARAAGAEGDEVDALARAVRAHGDVKLATAQALRQRKP